MIIPKQIGVKCNLELYQEAIKEGFDISIPINRVTDEQLNKFLAEWKQNG